MKIKDNRGNNKIQFCELCVGQVFIMPNDSDIYMKIESRTFSDYGMFSDINVINLRNCNITNFDDCETVIPLNAILVIDD